MTGEDSKNGRPTASPNFTMTFDASRTKWQLSCRRCAKCAYAAPHRSCESLGGQTLAQVSHLKEEIGQGVAMCMDVDIPDVADGSCDVWCPLKTSDDERKRIELASKRPKWNARLKSLVMDFKGRVQCASAKNFQLCLDERAIMIFGKQKDGTFSLDFE